MSTGRIEAAVGLACALALAACGGGGGGGGEGGTFSISGAVTGAPSVTVALSGAAGASTTTDAAGAYSFAGLASGSYTVTPSKPGFTFSPPSASVTIVASNVTGTSFAASGALKIAGKVTGDVLAGVAVALTGAAAAGTTTDAAGDYSFSGLSPGDYTVTPSRAGYAFFPPSLSVALTAFDSSGNSFVAQSTVPAAPTGVSAVPGNGAASVSFTGSAGATGYNVYYAATPAVTKADPKVAAAGSPATVPSLPNGAARYFAVSAVKGAEEGPLSLVVCAVPTASVTTGLTLYDGLCGERLDGMKWWQPGAYSVGVSGGAAVLSVDVADQEPRSLRNAVYLGAVTVASGASRVTTISADVAVPASGASQTGSSDVRGAVRILYSPPASRLAYPGNVANAIVFEVGLVESGSGLHAYRNVAHIDDALGSSVSQTNLAIADPPSGWGSFGVPLLTGAPAAYATTYTVSAWYDEAAARFGWKIAGGAFGAGVTGSADPAAYLAATPAWSGVPLAGSGFWFAGLAARTHDRSAGGGGGGRLAATFDNVRVGLDGAAAAPWDDFSGAGGNSGPAELSLAKWSNGGRNSVMPAAGSLAIHQQATGTGASASAGHCLFLADATAANTVQADVTIPSFATGGSTPGLASALVQGRFYNDGTPGGAPPDVNQAHSAVGDILAGVNLNPAQNDATYSVLRCTSASCSTVAVIASGLVPGVTVGTGVHPVRVRWDPATHTFIFIVDGTIVSVDPTPSAPVVGTAHAPMRRICTSTLVAAVAGSSASVDAKVNNVFTAP